jgi:DNA-binding MarR family transcriptional regulator
MTSAQYTLLSKLARRPGFTMAELADEMVMDRTSVVRALKPLQRDGYIVSTAWEHDPRAHAFQLTPEGEELLGKARQAWRNAQDEFEQQFGSERARVLRGELYSLTGS